MPIRRLLLLLGLSVLTSLPPHAWSQDEEEAPSVDPAEMQAHVKVTPAREGEMPIVLHTLGMISTPRQEPGLVTARISGIVASVEARDGQRVSEGGVLIRLDPRAAQAAFDHAQASLQQADGDLRDALSGSLEANRADLDLAASQAEVAAFQAQREAEHQETLLRDHLTSERAASDARQAAEVAVRAQAAAEERARQFRNMGADIELARRRAAVEQASAEVRAAELDLEATEIRAPLAGRVSRLTASVGQMIESGATVASIDCDGGFELRLALAPADVDSVSVGAPVAVTTVAGDPVGGQVVSIGGGVDPDSGLVPVIASLPESADHQRVGEWVKADITTSRSGHGLIVPVSALNIADDKATVFTVDDQHIAQSIPVEVLARNAQEAVVVGDGLSAGAPVIFDGNYNLPDGARVVEEPAT
jgi:RND family efflux transporter MFP subunit